MIDVVLLAADRLVRAPLRAQLIEDGFEVIATDTWPMMRQRLRPGEKPLLAIVDLHDLADAEQVLRDLRVLMKPERVLVLAVLGGLPAEDIECPGYIVLRRPLSIGDIVKAARSYRERKDD